MVLSKEMLVQTDPSQKFNLALTRQDNESKVRFPKKFPLIKNLHNLTYLVVRFLKTKIVPDSWIQQLVCKKKSLKVLIYLFKTKLLSHLKFKNQPKIRNNSL